MGRALKAGVGKAAERSCVDGTVTNVVYRNDETGYSVLRVGSSRDGEFHLRAPEVVVVGTCGAVWEGEELHAEGEWVTDKTHGRQFKASSIACVTPRSETGIERYLASGLIKGIGPEYAKRIVAKFGAQTLEILDHFSARLKEVPGIGPTRIAKIKKSWEAERGTREVMIFTQGYGISVSKTVKIWKTYGADSIAVIKADPYRLCRDIWGIGFSTADKIATSVGMPKDAPQRCRAAVVHVLQTEAEDGGHCWTSEAELLLKAQELVSVDVEKLAEALKAEAETGRVVLEPDGEGSHRAYLRDLWLAEKRVANKLKALAAAPRAFEPIDAARAIDWWEKKTGFRLAPAQARAVKMALESKLAIVTGGPGVGKTTIIRAVIDVYGARKDKQGQSRIRVRLAAPTGRAAKRMSESTGAPAQTIHRLLKYNPQTREFTYNAENPLEGDVFVFDETSMVDVRLMATTLAALPPHAVAILVGDTDQLPSVGPGNVLNDLINSNAIPCARLTDIFRQDNSGLIVRNAHHVNNGEAFELPAQGAASDFYFIAQNDPERALGFALDFMTDRIPRKFRMDPKEDVQVLTPMRRNALGAENLNAALQRRLNPDGSAVQRGGTLFRVGDRVMQLRNNYDKDVYNGDVGFVLDAKPAERELVVSFDGRPVEYGSGDLDELQLAYATTIHKSQGSEYPAVIVLLHNQHYMMLQRNLLYTAITRGRKLVLVIGSAWAVNKAVETNTVRARRTTLAERLAADSDR
ncbi:MAG: ATP-dependent RecD-like DNA helicase [Kiritimatiellae bacterium]|nr:ATP-dependent RecD-like DNA helicase [Kiritimatiellia bacterium]